MTNLNTSFTGAFPLSSPKLARATNKRYCSIVSPSAASNYGAILAVAQTGLYVVYVNGSTNSLIIKSDGAGIALSQSNSTTSVIDFGTQYAQSLIVLGGALASATISYSD